MSILIGFAGAAVYLLIGTVVGGVTHRMFNMKPRRLEYGHAVDGEGGAVWAGMLWPGALIVGAIFVFFWVMSTGFMRGVRSISNIGKEKMLTE